MDQRQRQLLLLQIVARWLACHSAVLGIVEDIVADLEGDADHLSITLERIGYRGIIRCACRPELAAGTDQRCCLVGDDPEILLLADIELARLLDLQQLSLAHAPDCIGSDLQKSELVILDSHKQTT